MLSIVSLLVVVVVSMLVVRTATVALTLTGLSRELSRFQARSAFTGAGFTTNESEKVVGHPVRRRIIMLLMLLGNAGIVTALSSLILSLVGAEDATGVAGSLGFRLTALLAGLAMIWAFAQSRWVDERLSELIAWALGRWTTLEVRDYARLLHLARDYAVVELQVREEDWLAERRLGDLRLDDEGVLVLGIESPKRGFLGAPRGDTKTLPGETLLLYGPRATLANLDRRRRGSDGNWEHYKAVDKQQQIERSEASREVEADQADESP